MTVEEERKERVLRCLEELREAVECLGYSYHVDDIYPHMDAMEQFVGECS